MFYTNAATTDGAGNLGTVDVSDSVAVDGDPVLMTMLDTNGNGLPVAETVELI